MNDKNYCTPLKLRSKYLVKKVAVELGRGGREGFIKRILGSRHLSPITRLGGRRGWTCTRPTIPVTHRERERQ